MPHFKDNDILSLNFILKTFPLTSLNDIESQKHRPENIFNVWNILMVCTVAINKSTSCKNGQQKNIHANYAFSYSFQLGLPLE